MKNMKRFLSILAAFALSGTSAYAANICPSGRPEGNPPVLCSNDHKVPVAQLPVEGSGTNTSSATNVLVHGGDGRLSDSRAPTGSMHTSGCTATYHTGTGTGTATDTATGTAWTLAGDATVTCTSVETGPRNFIPQWTGTGTGTATATETDTGLGASTWYESGASLVSKKVGTNQVAPQTYSTDSNASTQIQFYKAHNSVAGTKGTTLDGERLGWMSVYGNSTNPLDTMAAAQEWVQDGNSGSNIVPGRWKLHIYSPSGVDQTSIDCRSNGSCQFGGQVLAPNTVTCSGGLTCSGVTATGTSTATGTGTSTATPIRPLAATGMNFDASGLASTTTLTNYIPWTSVEGTGTHTSSATNTLVHGGDGRLSDARAPTGSINATSPMRLSAGTATATNSSVALASSPTVSVAVGTTAGTVAAGDDTRITGAIQSGFDAPRTIYYAKYSGVSEIWTIRPDGGDSTASHAKSVTSTPAVVVLLSADAANAPNLVVWPAGSYRLHLWAQMASASASVYYTVTAGSTVLATSATFTVATGSMALYDVVATATADYHTATTTDAFAINIYASSASTNNLTVGYGGANATHVSAPWSGYSQSTPSAAGTAAIGVTRLPAMADHVHPLEGVETCGPHTTVRTGTDGKISPDCLPTVTATSTATATGTSNFVAKFCTGGICNSSIHDNGNVCVGCSSATERFTSGSTKAFSITDPGYMISPQKIAGHAFAGADITIAASDVAAVPIANEGKVIAVAGDTPDVLYNRIIGGTGITTNITGSAPDRQVTISLHGGMPVMSQGPVSMVSIDNSVGWVTMVARSMTDVWVHASGDVTFYCSWSASSSPIRVLARLTVAGSPVGPTIESDFNQLENNYRKSMAMSRVAQVVGTQIVALEMWVDEGGSAGTCTVEAGLASLSMSKF